MFKSFDNLGFDIGDVIAICEYGGDIVAVRKSDKEMIMTALYSAR